MVKIDRHSYVGPGIDSEVVDRQARERMTDKRSPESSVVHYHPQASPCKDARHTVYTKEDQKVTTDVYVDDPYDMWFRRD